MSSIRVCKNKKGIVKSFLSSSNRSCRESWASSLIIRIVIITISRQPSSPYCRYSAWKVFLLDNVRNPQNNVPTVSSIRLAAMSYSLTVWTMWMRNTACPACGSLCCAITERSNSTICIVLAIWSFHRPALELEDEVTDGSLHIRHVTAELEIGLRSSKTATNRHLGVFTVTYTPRFLVNIWVVPSAGSLGLVIDLTLLELLLRA